MAGEYYRIKEMGVNTKNWIDLAQDRDYWRALVNVALKSGFISHGVSYIKLEDRIGQHM